MTQFEHLRLRTLKAKALALATTSLVEASAMWSAVVSRYSLWCAMARALYGRLPPSDLQDRRVSAIEADVIIVKTNLESHKWAVLAVR